MHMQMNYATMMPEEDMAYTILADLKRVTREYATAALEASCPDLRKLFTDLLNSTLHLQGTLYETMKQNNMYNAASPALRQEIGKQLKQNQQTLQKTQQLLQQLQNVHAQPQFPYYQQPQSHGGQQPYQ